MANLDTGRESIDLKRLWKQFLHRISLVIAAVIAGAIIGVLAYYIYGHFTSPGEIYQVRNDYYITFNTKDYPNGVDYYNAYTWDNILRDDPIVMEALSLAPSLNKSDVLATVSGEMLGDYRILTVVCKGQNGDLVKTVSDAYRQAVPAFADKIGEISTIEAWTDSEMTSFNPNTRGLNAAFLGALIALIIALFAVAMSCALDDGIYTESDWLKRYASVPFLGKKNTDEYKLNLAHMLGREEDYKSLAIDDFAFSAELFDSLRAAKGVILVLNEGKDKAEAIDKVVFTLNKQDIKIVGMMFADK